MFLRVLVILAAGAGALAVICQTTGGSPFAVDADNLANQLSEKTNTACQNGDSGCANIGSFGTASVDLCGPKGTCVPFAQIAQGVRDLVSQCSSNGLAGGINPLSADGSVHSDLFHA
ncbi:hypothetical protein C8R45DRAFT_1095332 [Mycena sanguinolenta]|nr:hypothetical protein C8R45DRAFT_1095332 [Mycena sanguinolenta]